MRAQCSICFNLLDGTVDIAACPCGHTFHKQCLICWMDKSSSCPSCRRHVEKDEIQNLFFYIRENCDEDEHVAKLQNQINNLMVLLSEKDKQRKELVESRDRLTTHFADSEAARELLLTKLNKEKNINEVMQRHRKLMERKYDALIEEMTEFRGNQRKLQNHETLVKDCESDIQEVIDQYSEGGEASLKQLASFLTLLKREYNKVLSQKTILQDQVSAFECSAELNRNETQKYKQEVIDLRKDVERTNEDLNMMGSQMMVWQEQLSELKLSIGHYSSETEKFTLEMIDLRMYFMKTYCNQDKVLSELRCSFQHYHDETQKCSQKMINLREDFTKTYCNIGQMEMDNYKNRLKLIDNIIYHQALNEDSPSIVCIPSTSLDQSIVCIPSTSLDQSIVCIPSTSLDQSIVCTPSMSLDQSIVCTPSMSLDQSIVCTPSTSLDQSIVCTPSTSLEPSMYGSMEDTENENTWRSPAPTYSRKHLKRKCVSELDGQKLKLAKTTSENLKASRHRKSVANDVPKVLQTVFADTQKGKKNTSRKNKR